MPERRALYAGSFDPPTFGHTHVFMEAHFLFDKVIVAVGNNPHKDYMFTTKERVHMLEMLTSNYGNVAVVGMGMELQSNFARKHNCQYLIRGIRNSEDFNYELSIEDYHRDVNPSLKTIYVTPSPELRNVSSSFVKGLTKFNHWEAGMEHYVPEYVVEQLKKKVKNG